MPPKRLIKSRFCDILFKNSTRNEINAITKKLNTMINEEKGRISDMIRKMPQSADGRVCHGDFHPDVCRYLFKGIFAIKRSFKKRDRVMDTDQSRNLSGF